MGIKKPIDVMIVGAQKSGTSSLKHYLAMHPKIATHKRDEISYFVDDRDFSQGYEKNYNRYYGDIKNEGGKILLGKSATLMSDEKYIERLFRHNSDCKIIVLLRDPVDRAYSAFWYAKRKLHESLDSFEVAIQKKYQSPLSDDVDVRNKNYLDNGKYINHIISLRKYFKPCNIKILFLEDMKNDSLSMCRDLFNWLNIDDFSSFSTEVKNKSALPKSVLLARMLHSRSFIKSVVRQVIPRDYADIIKRRLVKLNEREFRAPPMKSETRASLYEYYSEYNEKLEKLLGITIDGWKDNKKQ